MDRMTNEAPVAQKHLKEMLLGKEPMPVINLVQPNEGIPANVVLLREFLEQNKDATDADLFAYIKKYTQAGIGENINVDVFLMQEWLSKNPGASDADTSAYHSCLIERIYNKSPANNPILT